MAKPRKSGPKSEEELPSYRRDLDRRPRPTPRQTNATRTRRATKMGTAPKTQGRRRRRRVRTENTNTTAAKKTPSPDNMVLVFDVDGRRLQGPLEKKYYRKYSPIKAKEIRDRHDERNKQYEQKDYRKEVLELHTPPSPAWSYGRKHKYTSRVEKVKEAKKKPRYITPREKELDEYIKILIKKRPSNPLISETRKVTPEKKKPKVKFNTTAKAKIDARRFNSHKTNPDEISIRSDKEMDDKLKHAERLASKPLSEEVRYTRTYGIRPTSLKKKPITPTSLPKTPRTQISPITMVSTSPSSSSATPTPPTAQRELTWYADRSMDDEDRKRFRELRGFSRVTGQIKPSKPQQKIGGGGSRKKKKRKRRRTKRRR